MLQIKSKKVGFKYELLFSSGYLSDHIKQIKINRYQFRCNEYRKVPIEFMLKMCSSQDTNQLDIPHMLVNSNLRCPLIKIVSPNATKMPPLLPSGRWMMELFTGTNMKC